MNLLLYFSDKHHGRYGIDTFALLRTVYDNHDIYDLISHIRDGLDDLLYYRGLALLRNRWASPNALRKACVTLLLN